MCVWPWMIHSYPFEQNAAYVWASWISTISTLWSKKWSETPNNIDGPIGTTNILSFLKFFSISSGSFNMCSFLLAKMGYFRIKVTSHVWKLAVEKNKKQNQKLYRRSLTRLQHHSFSDSTCLGQCAVQSYSGQSVMSPSAPK